MINYRRLGLPLVAVLAAGILIVKWQERPAAATQTDVQGLPQVLMVADMSEAGGNDGCAKIIAAVEAAKRRNVAVAEFNPGDRSELISRYRVLVSPTVLLLAPDGAVMARFEGESPEVLTALQAELSRVMRR